MIEPAPGVHATAEPARWVDAEQTQTGTFAALFSHAASSARGDSVFARDTRRTGQSATAAAALNPTEHAVQELATPGPMKATVALAVQEQVSPSDNSAQPHRAAQPPAQSGAPAADNHNQPPRQSIAGEQSSTNHRPQPAPSAQPATPAQPHRTQPSQASPQTSITAAAPPPQPLRAHPAAQSQRIGSAPAASQPAARALNTLPGPNTTTPRSTAAARARPGPPPPPADPTPHAQFARGLAAALRQGGGTVTLHLKPEQLGDLKIRMDIRDGAVAAHFEVRSQAARGLLNDSIDKLRAVLEAKGLEVNRLDVQLVERKHEHEAQDALSQDAGDSGDTRHGGRGRGSATNHAAGKPPHSEPHTEVLPLPVACAELYADLGGALRLNLLA